MKSPLALPLATLALAAAGPGADWRVRLPLTLMSGAKIERVELPAAAILALQRSDGDDIRVLDADGRAQPIARLPAPAPPSRPVTLEPLPILGAADALKVTGVTLKVDGDQARVMRVDGAPVDASAGQALLGVLLDVRASDEQAQALVLDVVAPASQPVTFTLESSGDLQNWSAQGERVLFRAGSGARLVMPLHDAELHGRMLRLTWRAQGRLLSPVSIAAATLLLSGSPDTARLPVRATLPPLVDRHTAAFALRLGVGPAAMRVAPASCGMPTAIQLFGRADREQPWTAVGGGVAASAGRQVIELQQTYREWRIVASASGEGFKAPPTVELRFAPVVMAFLAAGRPPYDLVAGKADAAASFVRIEILQQMAGEAATTSAAMTAAPATPSLVLPAIAAGAPFQTWLLWGILLLGVAMLAAMAWTLTRPTYPAAS